MTNTQTRRKTETAVWCARNPTRIDGTPAEAAEKITKAKQAGEHFVYFDAQLIGTDYETHATIHFTEPTYLVIDAITSVQPIDC
jgi:hypothetical protein